MNDGQSAASFLKRALAWFCAWAKAMEQTEATVLDARIARLEDERFRSNPAAREDAGGGSKDREL